MCQSHCIIIIFSSDILLQNSNTGQQQTHTQTQTTDHLCPAKYIKLNIQQPTHFNMFNSTSSPFTPPPSYQLIAAQSWNVRSPPPANSNSAAAAAIFQGSTNIPSKPNRRVSVELYVTVSAEESGRSQKGIQNNNKNNSSSEGTIEALENGHVCVFRFLSKNEYRTKSSSKNPLWKTTPRTSNKHDKSRSKKIKNNNTQAEQVSGLCVFVDVFVCFVEIFFFIPEFMCVMSCDLV